MSNTPESDWKYMSSIQSTLLERLCERINQQMTTILNDTSLSAHERYLKIYQAVKTSDKDVARAFDDWRRSTLFSRLLEICRQKLMTDEELQKLSPETRQRVDSLKNLFA